MSESKTICVHFPQNCEAAFSIILPDKRTSKALSFYLSKTMLLLFLLIFLFSSCFVIRFVFPSMSMCVSVLLFFSIFFFPSRSNLVYRHIFIYLCIVSWVWVLLLLWSLLWRSNFVIGIVVVAIRFSHCRCSVFQSHFQLEFFFLFTSFRSRTPDSKASHSMLHSFTKQWHGACWTRCFTQQTRLSLYSVTGIVTGVQLFLTFRHDFTWFFFVRHFVCVRYRDTERDFFCSCH